MSEYLFLRSSCCIAGLIWTVFQISDLYCKHNNNELFYLASSESLTEDGKGLPSTPLLNRLPSNAVENTAVIGAPGTVFPLAERLQHTENNNHELQARFLVNESKVVQSSTYEGQEVPGTSFTVREREIDKCDNERASLTRTV